MVDATLYEATIRFARHVYEPMTSPIPATRQSVGFVSRRGGKARRGVYVSTKAVKSVKIDQRTPRRPTAAPPDVTAEYFRNFDDSERGRK